MSYRKNEPVKRVPKACDRCKIRKLKCSNTRPCGRCELDQAICQSGIRSRADQKPVSHMLVALAEEQQAILMRAVRKLWNKYATADDRAALGPNPSINEIVKSLGILDEAASSQFTGTDSTASDSEPSQKRLSRFSNSSSSEIGTQSRATLVDLHQLADPISVDFQQLDLQNLQNTASSDLELFHAPELVTPSPLLSYEIGFSDPSNEYLTSAAPIDMARPPGGTSSSKDSTIPTMDPRQTMYNQDYRFNS